MATLDIDIQDLTPSKFDADLPKTFVDIRDGELAAKTGIIQLGVIPVIQPAAAGTLVQHRATSTTSDIGGYRKLAGLSLGLYTTRTTTFDGTPIPTGEQPIEEYDRSGGVIEGVESNNSTETVGVRARKVTPGAQVCKVRMEVYHRTSGGTETLLGSFTTPDLTSSFANYEGEVTIDQAWATGERIVLKAVGINEGVPP